MKDVESPRQMRCSRLFAITFSQLRRLAGCSWRTLGITGPPEGRMCRAGISYSGQMGSLRSILSNLWRDELQTLRCCIGSATCGAINAVANAHSIANPTYFNQVQSHFFWMFYDFRSELCDLSLLSGQEPSPGRGTWQGLPGFALKQIEAC